MATKSYNGIYYDPSYDYQKDLNKLDKNAANYNSLYNSVANIRNAKIQGEGLGRSLTNLLPENTKVDVPQFDVQGTLDRLTKAKEDSIVAGLGKARDNALSGLSGEQAKIQPMYYDRRNQVAAQNQMGRRSLAEELARRGETNSGVADEANIRANMSLQGETGLLNRQEAADVSDIERRRSDAQTAYEYDLANARAGLQTASLEQQIAEMRRQQDMARDDARYADTRGDVTYDRNYQQNRDNIGDSRYTQENKIQQFVDTIGRFYNDFKAEVNNVKNDGDTSNDWQIPYLEAARQNKVASQEASKTEAGTAQYNNALEMWKISGVADDSIAGILGVPVGAKTADYNIASINANTAKINATKSGTKSPKTDIFTLDDWAKILDSEFLPKYDSYGNVIVQGISDKLTREQRILDLNLDEGLTEQLYKKYGIPIPPQ
jgi:hypothetical protein